MSLSTFLNLRFVEQSCITCRYIRTHETGAFTAECLLLGRTMAIGEYEFVIKNIDNRVCDGWKKRPKNWIVLSKGTDNCPYWHDPYLPREMMQRKRAKLEKAMRKRDTLANS